MTVKNGWTLAFRFQIKGVRYREAIPKRTSLDRVSETKTRVQVFQGVNGHTTRHSRFRVSERRLVDATLAFHHNPRQI